MLKKLPIHKDANKQALHELKTKGKLSNRTRSQLHYIIRKGK